MGKDDGGGSVILPGPVASDLAPQNFGSYVVIGRARHEFGRSFVSLLYTGREIDGGGSNRVIGPDFRWQPNDRDAISGQILLSRSETPNRPELASEWNGQSLSGWGGRLQWSRSLSNWDFYGEYRGLSHDFRADLGYLPQVGYTQSYGEVGYTFYPKDKPVSRLRLFAYGYDKTEIGDDILVRGITSGFGGDAIANSFYRLEVSADQARGIERVFDRVQIRPVVEIQPGGIISFIGFYGTFGDQIDYAHDRLGTGTSIEVDVTSRPTDHLQISLIGSRRTLDVDTESGLSGRLFTAQVARLRSVYTFNSRAWLRLVGQWTDTSRDPRLYDFAVARKSGDFSGSAVFAYKINWQTVAFIGYGDDRILDTHEDLQPYERQFFAKISYAFQQ